MTRSEWLKSFDQGMNQEVSEARHIRVFLSLSRMMRDYCRLFHGSEKKKRFCLRGVLVGWFKTAPSLPMPILCESCRQHLSFALVKKGFCPHQGNIPCSVCPAPCMDEGHRRWMRNVMLLRVFILFITLQWRPIVAHMLAARSK